MDLEKYSEPDQLERYSFLWSEVRLVIAAVALFLGGIPVLPYLIHVPALSGMIRLTLTLTWIISGLAAGYLLYRWKSREKMLFDGRKQMDTVAFLISVISGLNLGVTGLVGTNIGMSISSNYGIFIVVGLAYLWATYYLWKRWQQSGQKVFRTVPRKV